MSKGIKPPKTFCGKKGRSGRKGYGIEEARKQVIRKSWNILDTRLDDVNDLQVALPIALKDMVEKKDIEFKPMTIKIIRADGRIDDKVTPVPGSGDIQPTEI